MIERACKRGHVGMRSATGRCIECRRILDAARVAAAREAYNARKRAERVPHRALLAQRAREARAAESPEQRAARLLQAKLKQREWRAKNPGHAGVREARRRYKLGNPDQVSFGVAQRRASKLQRTPKWLTADDLWMMREAYGLAKLRNKLFEFKWHVDHIVPLQGATVSGLHVPWNLRVIPAVANVKKGAKFIEELA